MGIYEQEALKKAQEVDEKVRRGEEIDLLAGIPCAVKDNICMKNKETSAASKMLENYKAPYDATVIKSLEKKDAVILGKTNLDEYAMGDSTENSAFGITKNPFDETRVAGGSSGGSAAVVAADMAAWSLGSDTGGSIRTPASFCGLVGLKPTYGRVSRYGLIAMASSFDQIGPITQTVTDAAIVLDSICGKDSKDNTTAKKQTLNFYKNLKPRLEGKKIGIIKDFFGDGLNDEIRKVIQEKIDWAAEQGAEIVELEMPLLRHSLAVYYLMVTSEISSNLARLDGIRYGVDESFLNKLEGKDLLDVYKHSRKEGFGGEPKIRIILGTYALSAGYYDAYYKKAAQVREVFKQEMKKVFEKVDVLLSPTSPVLPFKIGQRADDLLKMYLEYIYIVTANVAMIPAISIPIGFVKDKEEEGGKKLPVGLQLMGKWWDEQNLLDISAALNMNQEIN